MSHVLGHIDQGKVRRAFLFHRTKWCGVIVLALVLIFSALFVVLQDHYFACAVLVIYVMAAMFGILFSEVHQIRKYRRPLSAQFFQPATSEHKLYTALWEESCRKAGCRSGGVYVLAPPDASCFSEHMDTFGISPGLLFVNERRLYISEGMLGKFTEPQMRAIVLHECGHMQWMPLVMRFVLDIAVVPSSTLLDSIAHARLRVVSPRMQSILYIIERALYFASIWSASQSEEYAADLYAAQQMGTAQHIISALHKLESDIVFAHLSHEEKEKEAAKLEMNAHLQDHPRTPKRIARLLALHDRSSR